MPFSDSAEPRRCLIFAGGVLRCLVANPPKEALTALADALAKRPVEELLFDGFALEGQAGVRNGRSAARRHTPTADLVAYDYERIMREAKAANTDLDAAPGVPALPCRGHQRVPAGPRFLHRLP